MQTYYRYREAVTTPGAIVVRLYHSADQVRGFIREIAGPNDDDTIFPGEEMEPEAAFRIANNKNRETGRPIFVELAEGLQWDPRWGSLV